MHHRVKVKGKCPSLIKRRKPQTAAAAAFCVTDRAGAHHIGRRLISGHIGIWPCGETATHSQGLPFNCLHHRNQCINSVLLSL